MIFGLIVLPAFNHSRSFALFGCSLALFCIYHYKCIIHIHVARTFYRNLTKSTGISYSNFSCGTMLDMGTCHLSLFVQLLLACSMTLRQMSALLQMFVSMAVFFYRLVDLEYAVLKHKILVTFSRKHTMFP